MAVKGLIFFMEGLQRIWGSCFGSVTWNIFTTFAANSFSEHEQRRKGQSAIRQQQKQLPLHTQKNKCAHTHTCNTPNPAKYPLSKILTTQRAADFGVFSPDFGIFTYNEVFWGWDQSLNMKCIYFPYTTYTCSVRIIL